jgi:hypothetical protein
LPTKGINLTSHRNGQEAGEFWLLRSWFPFLLGKQRSIDCEQPLMDRQ